MGLAIRRSHGRLPGKLRANWDFAADPLDLRQFQRFSQVSTGNRPMSRVGCRPNAVINLRICEHLERRTAGADCGLAFFTAPLRGGLAERPGALGDEP